MAVVVMLFDVFEIHSLLNSGLLIQIPGVSKEFRIATNPAQISFEVSIVNRLKADQGGEQTPVGFCDPISKQETTVTQP